MDAWWLAFESTKLADKELRDADRVLRHNGRSCFAAKRVEGANNADILRSYVQVKDWVPVDTKIRISDPAGLVDLFGEKALR